MIYLDNAATTMKKPQEVLDAVLFAMGHLGNAGHGTGEASLDAARVVFDARKKIDRFFDGDGPGQTVFTANVTQALNTALNGLLKPGDHVITTVCEHNSVLRPLYRLMDKGVEVSFVGTDPYGRLLYDQFEELVRPETKMVVCTHASNVTGNVTDIRFVGGFCRKHGLLFVLDTAQSAGLIPISLKEDGIDVVCFTGHKSLYGPQGTGGLCVRKGVDIEPLVVGGSGVQTFLKEHPSEMPVRLEAGTLNSHGIAGLSAGISYIEEHGLDHLRETALARMRQFYEGVKEIPGIIIYGDIALCGSEDLRSPVVSLNFEGADAALVSDDLMMEYEVMTRAGGHCAPLMHEALGTGESGCVRFSFSHMNTEEEVEQAVAAVREIGGSYAD